MDDLIKIGVEDYLNGRPSPEFQKALEQDPALRSRVEQMQSVSRLLSSLRDENAVDVPPGFYARLTGRIEEAQAARSAWNPFSFQSAFGRRVALASLLTVSIVGGYLVARDDSSLPANSSPEAILASHDVSNSHDPVDDRPTMMVTLAAYQQR
jgi:hypothetical protein